MRMLLRILFFLYFSTVYAVTPDEEIVKCAKHLKTAATAALELFENNNHRKPHMWGLVNVRRARRKSELYMRSGRSINFLKSMKSDTQIPPEWLDLSSLGSGKSVLDVGTGEGDLVEDLRSFGINAIGVDIVLSPAQTEKHYFREMDGALLDFETGSMSFVYSIWSVVSYEGWNKGRNTIAQQALAEMIRVTKKGGRIRLVPVERKLIKWLLGNRSDVELLPEIPGDPDAEPPIDYSRAVELLKL